MPCLPVTVRMAPQPPRPWLRLDRVGRDAVCPPTRLDSMTSTRGLGVAIMNNGPGGGGKGGGGSNQDKSDRDNHANQLNPNNDAYWSSRGQDSSDDDDDD